MLRLSRISDYGIVLLAHLASDPARQTHAARELADESGLPLPVVSKILKLLTQGGVLVSHRGTKGGYGLARAASEIRVTDVLCALEGPVAMVDCSAGPGHCDHETRCVVRSPLQRINEAVAAALSRVTLAELIDPPAQGFAHMFERREGDERPGWEAR